MKKIVLLLSLTLLLAGCQPTMFGMPEGQFKQLTPSQQTQVINSYNRQQEMKTQMEPINNAVNTLGYLGSLNAKS